MKTLNQQLVSLELAQKMKEFGFKQESFFVWLHSKVDNKATILENLNMDLDTENFKYFSAYTVAELGEMLPDNIKANSNSYWLKTAKTKLSTDQTYHVVYYEDNHPIDGEVISFTADTEADARGKMLIYLVENNLITI